MRKETVDVSCVHTWKQAVEKHLQWPTSCSCRLHCSYLDDTIVGLRKGIAKAEQPAKPRKGEAPPPPRKVRRFKGTQVAPASSRHMPCLCSLRWWQWNMFFGQTPLFLRCLRVLSGRWQACRCMLRTGLVAGTPRSWRALQACTTRPATASLRMLCSRYSLVWGGCIRCGLISTIQMPHCASMTLSSAACLS